MEKEPQQLHLTFSKNELGEEGFYLSQNELHQMLKNFRLENNLSFELLGKLADINPDILQAYEDGQFSLRLEAYHILLQVYATLNNDFKAHH